MTPYFEYYKCLKHVFNFNEIKSVCDVGCSTGHLLYYLKENDNLPDYFKFMSILIIIKNQIYVK